MKSEIPVRYNQIMSLLYLISQEINRETSDLIPLTKKRDNKVVATINGEGKKQDQALYYRYLIFFKDQKVVST